MSDKYTRDDDDFFLHLIFACNLYPVAALVQVRVVCVCRGSFVMKNYCGFDIEMMIMLCWLDKHGVCVNVITHHVCE